MRIKWFLVLLAIAKMSTCFAQAPDWAWAKRITFTYTPNQYEQGYLDGMTLDDSGNVYITGVFYDTMYLDNTMLTGYGSTDIFVAKYSPNGTLIWASKAGGPGIDIVGGICLDSHHNLYICGSYSDTAQFNSYYLNGYETQNMFVAEYNIKTGQCDYVRSIGVAYGYQN